MLKPPPIEVIVRLPALEVGRAEVGEVVLALHQALLIGGFRVRIWEGENVVISIDGEAFIVAKLIASTYISTGLGGRNITTPS